MDTAFKRDETSWLMPCAASVSGAIVVVNGISNVVVVCSGSGKVVVTGANVVVVTGVAKGVVVEDRIVLVGAGTEVSGTTRISVVVGATVVVLVLVVVVVLVGVFVEIVLVVWGNCVVVVAGTVVVVLVDVVVGASVVVVDSCVVGVNSCRVVVVWRDPAPSNASSYCKFQSPLTCQYSGLPQQRPARKRYLPAVTSMEMYDCNPLESSLAASNSPISL